MKKNEWLKGSTAAFASLCISAVVLTGCGRESVLQEEASEIQQTEMPQEENQQTETPQAEEQQTEEQQTEEQETVSAEETGTDPDDDGSTGTETEADDEDKGAELWRAQIRHYYGGVLSQIIAAWQLPDGELDTSSLDGGFGEMRDNHFAVTDIDGDGREELIVSYANATMAGMFETVYDYDPAVGRLTREFTAFPALTYYDNGMIKAEASHNHTRGIDFWPFALYQYQADSDTYVQIAYVDTWSKEVYGQWDDRTPFPDELDADGDGTLYNICEGAEASYEFADYQYNEADYEAWYQSLLGEAKEVSIDYQPMEYESFAEFTPAYLRLYAEEAGKDRTDTEADLGLLILEEDHYLDAAENLLAERYGVEIQRPYEDFEEAKTGVWEGKEIFSFEHLNAGFLDYYGEKVEDVTIFGLYPGIDADSAWEKLGAYGFYASPYGETENCLITGEGFGNISVWFSEEDGKVTQISVMPFCAFAG